VEQQKPEVVPGSSNVTVIAEGRVAMHRMQVAAFEVTEHQLRLITVTSQDAGIEFNVFIACASVAITILLALNTTEIPKPDMALWWRGGFVSFSVLAVVFFVMWVRKRSEFKDILVEIRNQKLDH
jgi:hypothetical protein